MNSALSLFFTDSCFKVHAEECFYTAHILRILLDQNYNTFFQPVSARLRYRTPAQDTQYSIYTLPLRNIKMSNVNKQQQQPQNRRSASVEIVEVRGRDQTTTSQQPAQQGTHRRALSSNAETRPENWEAAKRTFVSGRGSQLPPRQTVSMYNLTVGQSDLTELYSAQYPPLDYGNSFASSTAQLLPEQVRRGMERGRPSLIPDGVPTRSDMRQPAQFRPPRPPIGPAPAVQGPSTQAASNASSTAAAPHPNARQVGQGLITCPAVQQAPVVAGPSTQATSTANTPAPALSAANTQPQPGPSTASTTVTASATQKELDTISRLHALNINDPRLYTAGTSQIPMHVAALVDQIKNLKSNHFGYPQRTGLKESMSGHFKQSGGVLKADSVLWQWYGDTRLFSRREWYYLVTEGRGNQAPWTT